MPTCCRDMGIRNMSCLLLPFLLLLSFSCKSNSSSGSDTISSGKFISGNRTIISQNGRFELGFFDRYSSFEYYIGIWYKDNSEEVVWVANENKPLGNASLSKLKLLEDGNLVLINKDSTSVWCSNSTYSGSHHSIEAVLLDSGNLVIRDGNHPSSSIWQSFDHPTNTWLPGLKLGFNNLTNKKIVLTSSDYYYGSLSLQLDPNGTGQVILFNGSEKLWQKEFESIIPPYWTSLRGYKVGYEVNENWSYLTYTLDNNYSFNRIVLLDSGELEFQGFRTSSLAPCLTLPLQPPMFQPLCDIYNHCGESSICDDTFSCACIQGFEPKNFVDWNMKNFSEGCARKTPLKCDVGGEDGFLHMTGVNLPTNSRTLTVKGFEECELACLHNCSCKAFTYYGTCFVWLDDLFNLAWNYEYYTDKNTELCYGAKDVYVRLAVSDLQTSSELRKSSRGIPTIYKGIIGIITFLVLIFVFTWIYRNRESVNRVETVGSLVSFRYKDLKIATRNFSEILGRGGFGIVYRGKLRNSTEIAVKKLQYQTKDEKQFRSEVNTIGIIQHINIVSLLGFCAEGTKRLLVYEYMPNGSLSSYLFRMDSMILDWKTRYQIALGTARGLAYLHEKCRDCIIHCDIKPDNILLDVGLSPKVADFGLAKLLGREFSQVLTTMRGTRGYLAPEWLSGAPITLKVDVYSYGMMLFEIISGRRNLNMEDEDMSDYFPAQAANRMNKGDEILSLLDKKLEGEAEVEELTRACRVACWCIQDDEKDRPSMGQIVNVLEGILEVDTPPVPSYLHFIAGNLLEDKTFRASSTGQSPATWSDISPSSQDESIKPLSGSVFY